LWKRALLHGLKTLARRHPGAALHAAGATVAYAGREAAHESADFVKEKIEDVSHTIAVPRPTRASKKRKAGDGEAAALLEKHKPEERRALTRLASHKHS
jgi:hypothetical protein